MRYSKDQVFQMFVEKLSGNISPEEEAVVGNMLLTDPSFGEIWRSLEEEAEQIDVREFLGGLHTGEALEGLKARISGLEGLKTEIRGPEEQASGEEEDLVNGRAAMPVRGRIGWVLSAAAVFLMMVTGSYLLFFRQRSIDDKEKIALLVKQRQPSVSLALSNGQTVDLGKANAGKPIALGNTTLRAGKEAMEYTSEDTLQSVLSVPAGANYKIVLSDGTEVMLNAATSLRFPLRFGRKTREVWLEGEAYFKVAGDAGRPFVVHTPLTRVNVLGTSFNVNTYEAGHVRTALVEGKVSTEGDDGQRLTLRPGYAAEYHTAEGWSSTTFDEEDELSWMSGVYYFHDMPLKDLVHIASRCYGIDIKFDKEKYSGRSLTGLLDKNKLPEFLNDLATTAHIRYHYSGNNLYLE